MRSLFYATVFASIHLSFQTRQPTCNEICKYPEETPKPLNWTKLEGKSFYLSLHGNLEYEVGIACYVMTNITTAIHGFRATFLKYLHSSPSNPIPMPFRFLNTDGGYYDVIEKVAAKLRLPELVEKDGRIDWEKESESIRSALEDPYYTLTDYENYVIGLRCLKNGKWYVRPYIKNPVPTANDVLLVWKVLHEHGIHLPALHLSACDKIL
ncbi:uncharacterized protein LOC120335929 [Styela clava]